MVFGIAKRASEDRLRVVPERFVICRNVWGAADAIAGVASRIARNVDNKIAVAFLFFVGCILLLHHYDTCHTFKLFLTKQIIHRLEAEAEISSKIL